MKTFTNFTDVAKELHFKVRPPRKFEQKPVKCSKCGGNMTAYKNTNVLYCTNIVEKESVDVDVNGNTVKVNDICGNYFLKKFLN